MHGFHVRWPINTGISLKSFLFIEPRKLMIRGEGDDRQNLLRRSRPPMLSAFVGVSASRGTRSGMIPPTTPVSVCVRCFLLFSRGPTARPGGVLKRYVCHIRSNCDVALQRFRRGGSPGSFLILHPLVHQLFDAPITQHHLHQRALRLPFLGVSEGKFGSVEMETIVVGFGSMAMTPGVATCRLA